MPLADQVERIRSELRQAADLCDQIGRQHGTSIPRRELNLLRDALSDGPSFVQDQQAAVRYLEGDNIDPDGADDALRAALSDCAHRVEQIRSTLSSTLGEHEHAHTHNYHSSSFLLWLSSSNTHRHGHGHSHSPHSQYSERLERRFRKLHSDWEDAKNALREAFEEFRLRVARRAEERHTTRVRNRRWKRRTDEEVEKEKTRANALKAELKAINERWKMQREAREDRNERIIEEIERTGLEKLHNNPVDGLRDVVRDVRDIGDILGQDYQHQAYRQHGGIGDSIDDLRRLGGLMTELNVSFGQQQHNNGNGNNNNPRGDTINDVSRLAGVVHDLDRSRLSTHRSHESLPNITAFAMPGANAGRSSSWPHEHDHYHPEIYRCPDCYSYYNHRHRHAYEPFNARVEPHPISSSAPATPTGSRIFIQNTTNGHEIQVDKPPGDGHGAVHTGSANYRHHNPWWHDEPAPRAVHFLHQRRSHSPSSSSITDFPLASAASSTSSLDSLEFHNGEVHLVHHPPHLAGFHHPSNHREGYVHWSRRLDPRHGLVLESVGDNDGAFVAFDRNLGWQYHEAGRR